MVGSFAWNWYEGKRNIKIGTTIARTANASYDGQQYGVYLGGGYKMNVLNWLEFTPLLSIQWSHLRLGSYTESEAGSMNLSVKSQDYDMVQSGLGASLAYPLKFDWGKLTSEIHGKWLYDYLGEGMTVTSTFTGGGPSFDARGCKPAQSSFDLGGKAILDMKNDVSVIGEFDAELKEEYYGLYGSVTVRYKF
jgi:outer membrane autotransporter protein